MKKMHVVIAGLGLLGVCLIGTACLYLFIVLMSAAGFSNTHVITNDLGQTLEVQTVYRGRGRHEAYKCAAGSIPCVRTIYPDQSMSLSGNEDGQPDYVILTWNDGSKEVRCIDGQIDNYIETETEDRINLFLLRGLSAYQSNLSQHPVTQIDESGEIKCGK